MDFLSQVVLSFPSLCSGAPEHTPGFPAGPLLCGCHHTVMRFFAREDKGRHKDNKTKNHKGQRTPLVVQRSNNPEIVN
jgi:hypothetical protein